MDKFNEKVDTDCSKQENGNDVEFSTEVMVVDVDKQDNNMLMVTKLISFANLWLIGEEDGDTERSGPAGRDRAGEGGSCWGWEVLEMKKWVLRMLLKRCLESLVIPGRGKCAGGSRDLIRQLEPEKTMMMSDIKTMILLVTSMMLMTALATWCMRWRP